MLLSSWEKRGYVKFLVHETMMCIERAAKNESTESVLNCVEKKERSIGWNLIYSHIQAPVCGP